MQNYPLGALTRLGFRRAYDVEGDASKARATYWDFFASRKTPTAASILKQASVEYQGH